MATVSRAVLEVLLDRVHQGVATISPEGTLTYANQRLASMLATDRAHLIGRPLSALAAEADRQALADALAAGRDGAAQCRLALPRGGGNGELQAFLTFAPLGHGQASCLVTDLSQETHVGVLAHEVRSTFGAIRDSVEVLKRSTLESDARHALDGIERQRGRMLALLNARE